MNIFATDINPIMAAQNLCDIHVRKMLLEQVQLLCTYLNINGIQTPYKSTHIKHPCQLWLDKEQQNVQWLKLHTQALIDEYIFRFGKVHASTKIFDEYCWYNLPTTSIHNIVFEQVMPEEYKDIDPIKAYKNYYASKYIDWNKKLELYNKDYDLYMQTYFFGDKKERKRSAPRIMTWTNRNMPTWIKDVVW